MSGSMRRAALIMGLGLLPVLIPCDASAEWYADVYGGGVFTNRTDLTVTNTLGLIATDHNMKVNTTWTAGGRVGYWFERVDWLGVGLDVFYFKVKAPSQTVPTTVTLNGATLFSGPTQSDFSLPVLGIGFDVLRVRAPLLRSEEFAHGRVQPYLSAGPALFLTWAGTPVNIQPQGQHASDVAVGAKASGGVSFLLTNTVALFGEYRFTHFTSKLSYQDTTLGAATDTYKTTFDSHQVIGGLSFRFP